MDKTSSPFNNLPSEVCEAILRQLSQNDALNLRLVNKRWKVLVDELYSNWNIDIDDKCPHLEIMLKLKIKEVNVCQLVQPFTFQPLLANSSILKYPDILEKLSMPWNSRDVTIQTMSNQYLHQLLLHSKNLTNLSLFLNQFNLVKNSENELSSYSLSKLLKLEIRIETIPLPCPENNVFVQIMNHSNLFNLRVLDIFINDNSSMLWRSVFVFLQTAKLKCKGLKALKIGGSYDETGDFGLWEVGNCCSTLQELEMRSILPFSESGFIKYWRKFVQCQSALRNLGINSIGSSALISNVALKNFDSLQCIIIWGLEAEETMLVDGVSLPYLNLGIFQYCRNLKKLDICLKEEGIFINFNRLPVKLPKLKLFHGLINSNEVLDFITGPNEVKILRICEAGTSGRFGFNGTILDILLGLEDLKYIFLCKDSINSSVSEEREKLKRIYTATSNRITTNIVDGNEVIEFRSFSK